MLASCLLSSLPIESTLNRARNLRPRRWRREILRACTSRARPTYLTRSGKRLQSTSETTARTPVWWPRRGARTSSSFTPVLKYLRSSTRQCAVRSSFRDRNARHPRGCTFQKAFGRRLKGVSSKDLKKSASGIRAISQTTCPP